MLEAGLVGLAQLVRVVGDALLGGLGTRRLGPDLLGDVGVGERSGQEVLVREFLDGHVLASVCECARIGKVMIGRVLRLVPRSLRRASIASKRSVYMAQVPGYHVLDNTGVYTSRGKVMSIKGVQEHPDYAAKAERHSLSGLSEIRLYSCMLDRIGSIHEYATN